ncbi:asparagine synthase (glutamine-hydrolyzing) [Gammaproteobacteria bacterium]|nr:asparagine synthase (glutamine-hydrolyzing) [Gammaproteobacteria bacterium]
MCGLAGCINKSNLSSDELASVLNNMASSLDHRGPDSSGVWVNDKSSIGFSHTRLAIQDTSHAGSQPMHSISGRYVLAFNGEIYNHLEIRESLSSLHSNQYLWAGQSDTETIVMAIDSWGLSKTLDLIDGMFAFSLWDEQEEELILCRDRLGEKPIYYGMAGNSFIFGSELKALKEFPEFAGNISISALQEYIRLSYVPSPMSIYESIFKLEPGYYLKVKLENLQLEKIKYWSLQETIASSKKFKIAEETSALKFLEESIESSVKSQMISDVPLGAFLSGGIDSSLIAAIMQKYSDQPIQTFTIGFEDPAYDESSFAQEVSDILKTHHHTLILNENDVIQSIKLLPKIYDEPFADSSQIPTYLVSKAAKTKVTVVLSGDAGDEIFGGYNRYIWIPRLWRVLQHVPIGLRNFFAKTAIKIKIDTWNKLFAFLGVNRPGEKLHKLSEAMLDAGSSYQFYLNTISQWKNPENIIKHPLSKKNSFNGASIPDGSFLTNDPEKMMFFDSMSYLPDDILTKVDRAAMSVGLETRVPFIDRKILELAWRLPLAMKIKNGVSKYPLRHILKKYIPAHLVDRPKTGFSLPIGEWLKGPLFTWAENLLDPDKIDLDGYFYSEPIQKIWQEHLSGSTDHSAKLWTVLMFQAWLQNERLDGHSIK